MDRRTFLKALGLGGSVSALSACGLDNNRYYTPIEQILPYVVRPEQHTPGTNTLFATTVLNGPAAYPLLATHRDGRVTMVEPNPRGAAIGATPGIGSAPFFELQRHYSPDRLKQPVDGGAPTDWKSALDKLSAAVKSARGSGKTVAWLGPHRNGTLVELVRRVFSVDALFWEPLGREAEAQAAEILFGQRVLPEYALERAHYVLSFGAEFLSTWDGTWSSGRYAQARDANVGHFVARFGLVSPARNLTGANADDWHACVPGTEAKVALAIARLVADKKGYRGVASAFLSGADVASAATASGLGVETLEKIASQVAAMPSLALPGGVAGAGPAATELAIAVLLINLVSGAFGDLCTLTGYSGPMDTYARVERLVEDLKAGKVGVLVVDDGLDPAHVLPPELGFADALAKAGLSVSLSSHGSQTACTLQLPTHDAFEDWGDESPKRGLWLLRQPAQTALYDSRSTGDVLLALLRSLDASDVPDGTWRDYLQRAWRAQMFPAQAFWDEVGGPSAKVPEDRLKVFLGLAAPAEAPSEEPDAAAGRGRGRGAKAPEVVEAPADPAADEQAMRRQEVAFLAWWNARLQDGYFVHPLRLLPAATEPTGRTVPLTASSELIGAGDFVLHAFPHPFLVDGRYANQPWAQEVPDPLTGQVWDTWVMIHPDAAAKLGVGDNDLLNLVTEAGNLELGVEISPLVRPDVVAVPMGNGRDGAGRYARNIGKNVFSLFKNVKDAQGAFVWQQTKVTVKVLAGRKADLVSTFGADTDHDRNFAVHVAASAFAPQGDAPAHHPGELTGIHHLPMDKRLQAAGITNMYPEPQHPTYRFAMAVDTDACDGCGACAVACYAENSLPVVGKEKVRQGREMGWLRVNRYFKGDETHFVPMMCQHCGHAPCESVCPVLATYHNLDGLNAMIYNRCVGTRYCSNACPYSARRFNYHSYVWPEPFNLQLNPDVSVRTMGVMEKCTFCVQRIQRAKVAAKDKGFNEKVPEADLLRMPACAAACPSQAISFGNLNNPESAPAKARKSGRSYIPIAELSTLPAVSYLAKVSFHADPTHGGGHGGHAAGHGDDHGKKDSQHASPDADHH